jgi:hypothetical protein
LGRHLFHGHPVMGPSPDHPAIPSSQDRSSNRLSISFSPKSRGTPLPSPRRLSPTADEPSSSVLSGPDRPPLPTRAATPTSELDRNSSCGFSLSRHTLSEDLNYSAPSSIYSASRPNTSHDRNESIYSSEYLSTSTRRLSIASGSSSSSLAKRPSPPQSPTSERDRNSSSTFSLSRHTLSEDLNHSTPSSIFSASRPNSSHDRNQSIYTSEYLSTSTRRLSIASGPSHSSSSSLAERPSLPQPVTSASSAILVS